MGRKRELTCQQVEAQLMAYLKRGLGHDRQQAIRDHLATCDACARSVREIKTLEAQLYAEAARHRPRLSTQASARVQKRAYRRMRRAIIMQRITQFAGAGVALAALALVVGFVALLLQQDSSETPSADSMRITVVSPTRDTVNTPTPEPSPKDTKATIVFTAETGGDFEGSFSTLARKFHDTHPNIVVEYDPLTRLAESGLRPSASRIAQATDCFVGPSWNVTSADLPLLMPLAPLLEAHGTLPLDDFYSVALDVRTDGQLWGLPLAIYPQVMFYKKRLFDAADLAYPSPEWTLDDFVELALALTTGEVSSKQYGYYPLPYSSDSLFFIEQYGARLIDSSTQPPTILFDDPATIEAVHWYADLIRVHGIMPEPQPLEPESLESWHASRTEWLMAMQSGRVAMWSGPSTDTSAGPWDGEEPRLRIVPMPQGAGEVVAFMTDTFYISALTEHPQACLEWFEYLTQLQAFFFSVDYPGLPSRRSAAESTTYNEQMGPVAASTLRAAVEGGTRLSLLSQPEEYVALTFFDRALNAILAGADVESALNAAQFQAQTYQFCTETERDYEALLACLQEMDPEFPWAEILD